MGTTLVLRRGNDAVVTTRWTAMDTKDGKVVVFYRRRWWMERVKLTLDMPHFLRKVEMEDVVRLANWQA